MPPVPLLLQAQQQEHQLQPLFKSIDLLRELLQLPRLALLSSAPYRVTFGQEPFVEISDPDRWSPGDVAILQNQEAKKVREIGSLIFDAP